MFVLVFGFALLAGCTTTTTPTSIPAEDTVTEDSAAVDTSVVVETEDATVEDAEDTTVDAEDIVTESDDTATEEEAAQ
ncbi:hypothetical protein KJ657_01140 [Patescibacteria group bacterium]|nr:hypothetical protein [Patescibacteria group bacterium]MBU1015672.1 hypothetical protein [Patescibacteria group bacterium]MBU1938999.1 hypothetical protein [Patescibacteria group bacterium]